MGNALKAAIASGTRINGLHLTFPQPSIIELLALGDLGYVYLDGEHGAFSPADIEQACIAAELHGVTCIARIPDPSPSTVSRFLDRGVKGIVVPHVDSVDDAKRVIDAALFAPYGNRSFGGARPLYVSGIPDMPAFLKRANEETSISIMIETRGALEAAGEMAALEGIDYMSFGMNDLAQSLGCAGRIGDPVVQKAVAEASERIRAAGKPVREDFINVGWINDIITAGAQHIFGGAQ